MARGKNRFLSYLEENFYDRIYNSIKSYVIRHREDLIIEPNDLIAVEDIDVENLGLMSAWIDSKDDSRIEFDLHVNPDISYVEVSGRHRDREASGTRLWLTLSCKAKVEDEIKGFFITNVDLFNKDTKQTKPLDEYMVPCISRSEYEKYANEMLGKYYPEAAKGDGPIDPHIIARRMGFTIIERSIRKDKSIFGQIYFDECTTTLFNSEKEADEEITIPANTIIIDPDANDKYSYGSKNITIAHECVHGYLHRKAFKFAKIINKGITDTLSCMTTGEIKGIERDGNPNYMECQANGIAPFLLLPRNRLVRSYEHELDQLMHLCCMEEPDAIEVAIGNIASIFNVTKYAVKKRLFDLGFEEVGGACNFIDGDYVRPFSFKKGSLKTDETFVLSFNDLIDMINDPKTNLLVILLQGNYVFVENHLCVSDEKYVVKNCNGQLVMTDYGRTHADECCLKFKVKSKGKVESQEIVMYCYLARGNGCDLSFDISVATDKTSFASNNGIESIDYFEKINEVKKKIRGMEFCEALSYLIGYQGLEIKEFTDDPDDSSSLSARQVERYKNGETTNLNKRVVVAICLALRLPPSLSEELLNCAGMSLGNSKDDAILLGLLMTGRGKKFDEINNMLVNKGYKPLTNTRN